MADINAGTLHVNIAGDTSELEKSLQTAENDLKGFDSSVGKSVQSLFEMKKEFKSLSRESLVGKSPAEIEAMTKRMAYLKDAIGDTNSTIKSLSLDPFQRLAETVQVGSTVMAGLAGATSLLGGEQEKMQELMQKTVALIAIANAAQEASVFFQERSSGIWIKNKAIEIAARLKEILTIGTATTASVAENAVKSKGSIITQAITKAQWLWNAAVAANPIGLLIVGIAALGAGMAVVISRFSSHNKELETAKANIDNLTISIDNYSKSNKYYLDMLRAGGEESKNINKERINQINQEIEKNEELIRNLKIAASETSGWGFGLSKDAKKAKEEIANVTNTLTELFREQQKINSETVQANIERNSQIKDENQKLRISLLSGQAKEVAELNNQYIKDLENWKDSEETKKLLTAKYQNELSEIKLRYANQDKRKQEEQFVIQAVPKIENPETKDLYLKPLEAKIPEQKIEFPVKINLKPEVSNIQDLIDISDAIGKSVTAGLNDLTTGIAESIGNIAAGTGGMDDLFQNMLSIIGDFLSSLGKSLIAAGIGAIAFDALLSNPFAAIAAGAALVALGAVVKAKLASGPSGSGSNYSSASTTSTNYDATGTRQLTGNGTLEVVVSGVLTGRGSDLQAVLDKEANRRSL